MTTAVDMNPFELIGALETAQGVDRGLFWNAFVAIHGARPNDTDASITHWLVLSNSFVKLLDANAYLDAAMMLLPKGWDWGCGGSDDPWGWVCPSDIEYGESMKVEAATPANALVAAYLQHWFI